jgi:hypothetical protein
MVMLPHLLGFRFFALVCVKEKEILRVKISDVTFWDGYLHGKYSSEKNI